MDEAGYVDIIGFALSLILSFLLLIKTDPDQEIPSFIWVLLLCSSFACCSMVWVVSSRTIASYVPEFGKLMPDVRLKEEFKIDTLKCPEEYTITKGRHGSIYCLKIVPFNEYWRNKRDK